MERLSSSSNHRFRFHDTSARRRSATVHYHTPLSDFIPSSEYEMTEDYEVVFMEEKLGLTLKCEEESRHGDNHTPKTIVKSAIGVAQLSNRIQKGDVLLSVNGESVVDLDFPDVLCILKVASRPIRLRFRTSSPRWLMTDDLTPHPSWNSIDEMRYAERPFVLPIEPHEERDDADSHYAVLSESFGDADSTRTTENSSVITDMTETEHQASRHSSRFTAFLRKPFRRMDGFDQGQLRIGIVPATPRVEVSIDSPFKAAICVYWRRHPKALSCQLQYSRDWTMKVWKNWSGRPRRSRENEHELVTLIYGLDYAKNYVVRIRYEVDQNYTPGEWSSPSPPIITLEPDRAAVHGRSRR